MFKYTFLRSLNRPPYYSQCTFFSCYLNYYHSCGCCVHHCPRTELESFSISRSIWLIIYFSIRLNRSEHRSRCSLCLNWCQEYDRYCQSIHYCCSWLVLVDVSNHSYSMSMESCQNHDRYVKESLFTVLESYLCRFRDLNQYVPDSISISQRLKRSWDHGCSSIHDTVEMTICLSMLLSRK